MSQLNISTLANLAGSETTPIADVVNGSARAWVNFNGTGTVAIRASYNVSSITDNGTGDYTTNFTTAMVDSDYCTVVTRDAITGSVFTSGRNAYSAQSTTSVRVCTALAGSFNDSGEVHVSIFR